MENAQDKILDLVMNTITNVTLAAMDERLKGRALCIEATPAKATSHISDSREQKKCQGITKGKEKAFLFPN